MPVRPSTQVATASRKARSMRRRVAGAASPRAKKPIVTVNCGAIPANLVESELFGHEKGAFTGAFERKIGKFVDADGGTILLHDSDCTSDPGSWRATIGGLPLLAPIFAERGLAVGPVGEHGI